jgi:hypothetical protein
MAKKTNRKNGAGPRLHIQRALVEMGFIIFLFYSNLLMGEYTRTNAVAGKSLMTAIANVITAENLAVAVVTSLLGHLVFEHFRKKL